MTDASEAPEADKLEQELPVQAREEVQIPPLEPEVPDADALEQHLPVPGDEDDYDRG